jgi:hypothetical protein
MYGQVLLKNNWFFLEKVVFDQNGRLVRLKTGLTGRQSPEEARKVRNPRDLRFARPGGVLSF